MADKDALTDIERAWLIGIDALMIQMNPNAHAAAAARIVELWDTGRPAFRQHLDRRVAAWRNRQRQIEMMASDDAGPCRRLVRLIEGLDQRTPRDHPGGGSRKPRKIVKPSTRRFGPVREMSDEEVQEFLKLLETEGIGVLFDPGVGFTTEGELHKPPLIRLDGKPIQYEQIAPVYDRREIERPWDPVEREPAIAVAFDLALLATAREKKWTWVISDRHFSRLPWGHPCKVTPEGRPGWKRITKLLDRAGLIERRRGQTWRLTREARRVVADHLLPAWIAAAASDRE